MYNIVIPGTFLLACLAVAALVISNNYKYWEDSGKVVPIDGGDEDDQITGEIEGQAQQELLDGEEEVH